MLDLYGTVGGRRPIDETIPALVAQAKRVADVLERTARLAALGELQECAGLTSVARSTDDSAHDDEENATCE